MEEVKLNRFLTKLNAMRDVAECLLSDIGTSGDGTGRNRLVFQVDKSEISDTCVKYSGTWEGKYTIHVGGWRGKWFVTDQEFEHILDEVVYNYEQKQKKLKAKKNAVKKVEKKVKKVEKKKAEPTKDCTNTTYLDVYKRVVDIMNKKTGYAPDRDIKDEENEEIDICIDDDGNEHKSWSSAKAFVGGDPKETSIFDEVADLYAIYDKLASRWDAGFADNCSILGEVDVKDTSPDGIMKALDEAGL